MSDYDDYDYESNDNEEYYLEEDEDDNYGGYEPILVNIEEEDKMNKSDASLQKREEKIKERPKIALDYTLKTPEERTALVNKIVESATPEQLTPYYLDILGTYIV